MKMEEHDILIYSVFIARRYLPYARAVWIRNHVLQYHTYATIIGMNLTSPLAFVCCASIEREAGLLENN